MTGTWNNARVIHHGRLFQRGQVRGRGESQTEPLGGFRRLFATAAAILAAAAVTSASMPASADQIRHDEWWLDAVHVPAAWHASRGAGVTVAVLDTGVDPAQADLSGAVITGPDYTRAGEMPGSAAWGVRGTALASLVAGRGHGPGHTGGVIGIAPAARILSVRVTLAAGDPMLADVNIASGLPGAIAHGIRYAVGHGASVIDLPLDPVTTPGAPGAGGSAAEHAAVSYALRHNVVLVAPAGDDLSGTDPVNYPAAYHGVIAVGAFDSKFMKTPFTSRQPYVTLTAPGAGMVAASTPHGYNTISSTSAASAVVAGIAALIRSRYPDLTPAQVTRALTRSTVYRPPGGRVPGSGYGTVDARRALLAAARFGKASPPPSAAAGAGDSAAARRSAAAPARFSVSSRAARVILGAAVVAFMVVVLLLVLLIRRRRRRAARLAPIRLAAQMQPRQPQGPGVAAGGAAAASRPPPPTVVGFASRSGGSVVTAGQGNGSLPQRQPVSWAQQPSSAPPWEPAPKPRTELPWATGPGLGKGSEPVAPAVPAQLAREPERSPWDVLAEEAWPDGPQVHQRQQQARQAQQAALGGNGTSAGSSVMRVGPGYGGTGRGGRPPTEPKNPARAAPGAGLPGTSPPAAGLFGGAAGQNPGAGDAAAAGSGQIASSPPWPPAPAVGEIVRGRGASGTVRGPGAAGSGRLPGEGGSRVAIPGSDAIDREGGTRGRPLFTWNPAEPTVSFPVVNPAKDDQDGS